MKTLHILLPVLLLNLFSVASAAPFSACRNESPTCIAGNDIIAAPSYGFYSTVATGGTTTTGEGSATRPRRTAYEGNYPGSGQTGDTWTDSNGRTWKWDAELEDWVSDTQLDDAGNPYPLGEPTVLLLFAAMAAVGIALRQKRMQKGAENENL